MFYNEGRIGRGDESEEGVFVVVVEALRFESTGMDVTFLDFRIIIC